jgi:hypothetical protein
MNQGPRWDCLMNETRGRKSRDTVSLSIFGTALPHTSPHFTVLQCTAVHRNALHITRTVLHCSVLYCLTVLYCTV